MTHQQFFEALTRFEQNWEREMKNDTANDKMRWIYHGVKLTVSFVMGTLMKAPGGLNDQGRGQ